jgi:hypothetical protein
MAAVLGLLIATAAIAIPGWWAAGTILKTMLIRRRT